MLKKLLWFHKCINYYFYRWQVFVGSPIPEEGAVFMSAAWIYINIFNLNLVVKLFWNIYFIPNKPSRLAIVLILLAILGLNYFVTKAGNKFEEIKKEFAIQDLRKIKREKTLTLVYFLLSPAVFFLLATLAHNSVP